MENGEKAFIKHFTNLNSYKEFWDFLKRLCLKSFHLGTIKMKGLMTAYTLRVGCSS